MELIEPVRDLLHSGSTLHSNLGSIYQNLALEEWLYRNFDFSESDTEILLLWRNRPAVVVGRHQNLWAEIQLEFCGQNQIDVSRRNSGGGTVFHDPQNLNLSFMSSRKRYNRKRNLEFLSRVLLEEFEIQTEISPREDLILTGSGEKISGTASKLNSHNAYHHCTLLVNVDRKFLRGSLRKQLPEGFKSNATGSVPSPVKNLQDLNPNLTIESLIRSISRYYPRFYGTGSENRVHILTEEQLERFSGLDQIEDHFRSWEWIYGKTPRFHLNHGALELTVEKGRIKEARLGPDQRIPEFEGVEFNREPIQKAIQLYFEGNPNSDLAKIVPHALLLSYQKLVN